MVMDCNSTFVLITMTTSLSCYHLVASVMQISEGGYVHHPCCFRLIKGHKIPWDFILCEGHVETYKNSYRSYLLHCFQFSSNCNVVFPCGLLESSSFTGYYCTRCKTGKNKNTFAILNSWPIRPHYPVIIENIPWQLRFTILCINRYYTSIVCIT